MNMKTAYKVYLFCCVLFLTGLFLLVPVYAVEDMWTAASRIIKDIYLAGHSTVDMTLRVYTHYDRQSREKQTIEKVREAFRKESA